MIVVEADFPSTVAVTVATPGAKAVTATMSPNVVPFTTERLLDIHEVARPVRRVPAASRIVAMSNRTSPATMESEVKFNDTEATGTLVTVTAAVAFRPPVAALIVTVPGAIAETKPFCETPAMAGFDDTHSTG